MEKPAFVLEFEKPLRELEKELDDLKKMSREKKLDLEEEIARIQEKIEDKRVQVYSSLTPWQRVQLARHPKRPYALDYVKRIFTHFQELHGDRTFGDDLAIVCGTAFLGEQPVMIIAQQKGRDTRENLMRNFGMPHPEGYRKALRFFKLAEKFHLPVICLIDTKAAYAGVGSEERHVSEAIARNLLTMSMLRTPIVAAIIGEGGSGGALGIGVADRLLILEFAYYSVIPPEGCAAILWRDRTFAPQAAEALKIGARELLSLGIVDQVVEEPLGGAHCDEEAAARNLQAALTSHLQILLQTPIEQLIQERYGKFRRMGIFEETAPA